MIDRIVNIIRCRYYFGCELVNLDNIGAENGIIIVMKLLKSAI